MMIANANMLLAATRGDRLGGSGEVCRVHNSLVPPRSLFHDLSPQPLPIHIFFTTLPRTVGVYLSYCTLSILFPFFPVPCL